MNAVDIAVVVVLLASGVFALMRGFVHEILAIAGWIAAALAALWGLPLVRPFVHPHINNATLADVAGGAAIFLVTLLLLSFITHGIAQRVRRSSVSAVDRSLGFAFGLLRGLALASLCFLVVDRLMAPDEPEVLATAKTRPLLATGARMLEKLIPGHAALEQKAKAAAEAAEQADQAKEIYDRLAAPRPKSGDDRKDDKPPAYDNRGLERLIETTTGK